MLDAAPTYYMAQVDSRADLKFPPPGEKIAIAMDSARSVYGYTYMWIYSDGKWSANSVLTAEDRY